MSSRMISSVVGCLIAAGLALGAIQGCGSSGSGSTETLQQACVKEVMCQADASTATATTLCSGAASTGKGGQSGTTCTNASAIESATSNCLKISDCTQFETCVAGIPKCNGGTGGTSGTGTGGATGATGGTSGATGAAGAHGTGGATATGGTSGATGGTSGAAGGSGAADCSVCTKAASCCTAIGEPTTLCNMISTSTCNAATGATQTTLIQTCQMIVTQGAALCP
jgi:hypothetical protein